MWNIVLHPQSTFRSCAFSHLFPLYLSECVCVCVCVWVHIHIRITQCKILNASPKCSRYTCDVARTRCSFLLLVLLFMFMLAFFCVYISCCSSSLRRRFYCPTHAIYIDKQIWLLKGMILHNNTRNHGVSIDVCYVALFVCVWMRAKFELGKNIMRRVQHSNMFSVHTYMVRILFVLGVEWR